MNPRNFKVQARHEKVLPWIEGHTDNLRKRGIRDGEEFLLTTGAKGKYHGGGWWQIWGYACDASDTKKIYNSL